MGGFAKTIWDLTYVNTPEIFISEHSWDIIVYCIPGVDSHGHGHGGAYG